MGKNRAGMSKNGEEAKKRNVSVAKIIDEKHVRKAAVKARTPAMNAHDNTPDHIQARRNK
jgi:hypothetical protein